MKIIETKPITHGEAKEILTKLEKGKELGHEQKLTLDYLRTLNMLNKTDLKKATSELSEIEGLKDHQLITLLNFLPRNEDEINTLFMKERVKLEKDKIKKIAGIIAKFVTKEKKK